MYYVLILHSVLSFYRLINLHKPSKVSSNIIPIGLILGNLGVERLSDCSHVSELTNGRPRI